LGFHVEYSGTYTIPSNPSCSIILQALVLHDSTFSPLGVGPAKNIDF
jgi:hypothetical protein